MYSVWQSRSKRGSLPSSGKVQGCSLSTAPQATDHTRVTKVCPFFFPLISDYLLCEGGTCLRFQRLFLTLDISLPLLSPRHNGIIPMHDHPYWWTVLPDSSPSTSPFASTKHRESGSVRAQPGLALSPNSPLRQRNTKAGKLFEDHENSGQTRSSISVGINRSLSFSFTPSDSTLSAPSPGVSSVSLSSLGQKVPAGSTLYSAFTNAPSTSSSLSLSQPIGPEAYGRGPRQASDATLPGSYLRSLAHSLSKNSQNETISYNFHPRAPRETSILKPFHEAEDTENCGKRYSAWAETDPVNLAYVFSKVPVGPPSSSQECLKTTASICVICNYIDALFISFSFFICCN